MQTPGYIRNKMQFLVGACVKHHKYTRVYVFRMKGGYGTAAISTQSTLQPGGKGFTSGYFPPHQHTKIFPSFVCVCAHSRAGGGRERTWRGGGEPAAFGGAPRAAGDNGRLTSVEQTPIFPERSALLLCTSPFWVFFGGGYFNFFYYYYYFFFPLSFGGSKKRGGRNRISEPRKKQNLELHRRIGGGKRGGEGGFGGLSTTLSARNRCDSHSEALKSASGFGTGREWERRNGGRGGGKGRRGKGERRGGKRRGKKGGVRNEGEKNGSWEHGEIRALCSAFPLKAPTGPRRSQGVKFSSAPP